ncbi:MAG: hypothetical protein R2862_00125 [Thermoanaerobaculia bacterium]
MQWKIARSGAFSEKLNRWAIDRGFPLLAWLAPRAPRWFLFFGARVTMAVVFFFHSKPLLAIGRNLARVLEQPADSRDVRRAVREMLCHFAYYWVDLFRFAQLPPERLRSLIVGGDLASIDPLRRLRDAGERILLLTAHLGNWELGAVMLGGAELPLSVVYVRDEFEQAERFRSPLLRGRADVQEIPIPSGRPLRQSAGPARVRGTATGGAAGRSRLQRSASGDRAVRSADPPADRTVPARPDDTGAAATGLHRLRRRPSIRSGSRAADRRRADGRSRGGRPHRHGDLGAGPRAEHPPLADAVVQLPRRLAGRFRRRGIVKRTRIADRSGVRELAASGVLDPGALLAGDGPLELEIGFGKGRYLLRRAAEDPGRRFCGIEIANEYFRLAARRLVHRRLDNLLLLEGDAAYFATALLPPGRFAAVHVYFPGPLAEAPAPEEAPLLARRRSTWWPDWWRPADDSGSPPTSSSTAPECVGSSKGIRGRGSSSAKGG